MEYLKKALQSLDTIKKVDDYGMFQMTYLGDYGFDDFLKIGAKCDEDIDAFLSKYFFGDISLNIKKGGCTVFTARNAKNEVLFCRNYDFAHYSPPLQLFTNPDNGHASVSTVSLMFLGYNEDTLPSGLNLNSFSSIISPYLPMDGVNEKGLAIGLMSVPQAKPPFDENKVTLNTTATLRLVLDKASTTDEAIELLKQYNIYFSEGINCHFLIADAGGNSAIIEYWDNDVKVTTADTSYQIASNFIAYNGLNIPTGGDEFERYDKVKAAIEKGGGFLSEEQAVDLLIEVGAKMGLQWSVMCNLSTLEGVIFANGNKHNLIKFHVQGEQ